MIRLLVILMIVFSAGACAEPSLIPYKILKKDRLANIKLSLDVEVPVIDQRLPNEEELGDLSAYLAKASGDYERVFVVFYLPGMEVDAGGFATAHHNPELTVKMIRVMLMEYPQYYYLIPDIRAMLPDYEPRL